METSLLSIVKTVTKTIAPDVAKYGKKLLGEAPSIFEKTEKMIPVIIFVSVYILTQPEFPDQRLKPLL
mgnify:CR=1 FL=1